MSDRSYNIGFVIGGRISSSIIGAISKMTGATRNCSNEIAALNKKAADVKGIITQRKEVQNLSVLYNTMGDQARYAGKYHKAFADLVAKENAAGLTGKSTQELHSMHKSLTAEAQGRQSAAQAKELRDQRISAFSNAAFEVANAMQPLKDFLSSSIKVGSEFQAQMSRVGAVSRALPDEMSMLTDKAEELGRTTVWSSSQAAEGMQYLAMAGFKTSDIMASMRGMLDLASAGAIDLGRAADISSNILTGFGLAASDMNRVGDILTNTFTSSNTSLEMLGQTMKYVAPIAKGTGASLETVAAMAGKLGDAGIQADQAGTALRAMFVRLAKQPRQTAVELKNLGISVADSAGNMRQMPEILKDVAEKTKLMGSAERAAAVSRIFGTEATSAAMALMDKAVDGTLQEYIVKLKEAGSAERVAAQQNDNLAGKQKLFKSAVEALKIQIANGLTPALGSLTDMASGVTSFLADLAKNAPWLSTVLSGVIGSVAVLASVAGPLANMVIAFNGLKSAFEGVSLWSKMMSMATNPVVLGLVAIAAAAVGLYLVIKNFGAITNYLKTQWNLLVDNFWTVIGFFTGPISAAWKGAWDGMKNIFAGAFNSLVGLAKAPLNAVIDLINRVIGGLNSLGGIEIAGMKVGFNIPQIPKLAQGGIISQPTLAMVGEGRESEAVIPLSKLESMIGGGTDGGMSVSFAPTIYVQGGGSDAYEQVRRGLSEGADDLKRQLMALQTQNRRVGYA